MSLRLAGWLVGGAVFGKVLGFAREVEMARLLGANIVADSFRGALTAVLLPVAPMQTDMLPSALIPLHRSWSEDGSAAARSATRRAGRGSGGSRPADLVATIGILGGDGTATFHSRASRRAPRPPA